MIPLAHAGHWTTAVVEVAPVLALLIWLLITTWRERRKEGGEPPG